MIYPCTPCHLAPRVSFAYVKFDFIKVMTRDINLSHHDTQKTFKTIRMRSSKQLTRLKGRPFAFCFILMADHAVG